MTKEEATKSGKITLDIELQDLLNIVSKSGNTSPISDMPSSHVIGGEDLKKAWFKHVLISMEKLNDRVETVIRVDVANLRKEIKEELKRVEAKAEKAEDELKVYKKDIIDPINHKVLTLTAKLKVWSFLAGLGGSGLMAFLLYLIKVFVIAPTIGGSP